MRSWWTLSCGLALAAGLACGKLEGTESPSSPVDGGARDTDASGDPDGGSADAAALPDADAGGPMLAPEAFFVTQVYPSIVGTCGGCHQAAAAGAFFGDDGPSTYSLFLGWGFDARTSNAFEQKGPHAGPPLDASQKAIFEQWTALENP